MAQFYWFLGHEQFQPEVLVEHAKLAEAAGFDGVMVSEHFHPWVSDTGAGGFAFTTLGAIAAVTERLQLMTVVTTPLFRYHPAVIAQAAATVDRLSSGRFALGIGTGENLNEGPLGYPFPPYAERAARLTEAIDILSELFSGRQLDYNGAYYQTHAAKLYSPPVHPLPVYMAAGGPKSARLAGQRTDGMIVSVKDPADARGKVIEPATIAAPHPESFKIIATRWSVMADNDTDAWQALQPWRGLRAPSRLHATNPAELQREADALPRAEIMAKYTQARTPDDVTAAYTPLITDIGADIVGMQITSTDQPRLIKEIGAHVLPALRDLKPAK